MLDGLRTRARARRTAPGRPFFVAFTGLSLVQMLSGCILSSERPDLALDVPPAYLAGRGMSAPPALDWWRGFRSRELTGLIEEAQTRNLDIAVAIALIVQADAQSKIAGAPLLPVTTANASSIHARPSQRTGPGGVVSGGGPSENQLYSATLNASYEIDFWGKNRAASLAAEETAVVSRFNKEVVVLSTIVSVAT